MKVYGGCFDGRHRLLVAAKSFAAAVRLWQQDGYVSLYYARQHACETGNADEIRVAMSAPGCVFKKPLSANDRDYARLERD